MQTLLRIPDLEKLADAPRICERCEGPNPTRYRQCSGCRFASVRKPCRACGGDKGAGTRQLFCVPCLESGIRTKCSTCRTRPIAATNGKSGAGYCRECKNDREYARRGKPCRRCGAVKVVVRATERGKGLCEACKPFCPTCLINPRSQLRHGYCALCRQDRLRRLCLQRHYGLTLEQWEAVYVSQQGACAICEVIFPSLDELRVKSHLRRDVATDHCHKTGRFRALLCGQCNFALGHLRDDPALVDKAAAYLRKHAP